MFHKIIPQKDNSNDVTQNQNWKYLHHRLHVSLFVPFTLPLIFTQYLYVNRLRIIHLFTVNKLTLYLNFTLLNTKLAGHKDHLNLYTNWITIQKCTRTPTGCFLSLITNRQQISVLNFLNYNLPTLRFVYITLDAVQLSSNLSRVFWSPASLKWKERNVSWLWLTIIKIYWIVFVNLSVNHFMINCFR